MPIDFSYVNSIGLNHIREWLPGGNINGAEYIVLNPTRDDRHAGSLLINLTNGKFIDNADDDFVGRDSVTLYAKLNGMRNIDAARDILAKYDPSYFPMPEDFKHVDTWYQLTRGHRDAPELKPQNGETRRWPLEVKCGQVWRTAMMIVRFIGTDGKKQDIPFTLWTDGKAIEWRMKALHGVKYPLYGLRALAERPNARVLLTEGQKTASVVQPILGDDWVAVGWYGGAGNTAQTDFDPLMGREVWYPFDADAAGRKAIGALIDDLHIKAHLVYPPVNAVKGWDLADAVEDGATREELEAIILADVPANPLAVVPVTLPESRPTKLETHITDEFREYVLENVYIHSQDKDGKPVTRVRNDWFYWLVDEDPAIRNSIKYDYTTGMKATAYDSTDLYDGALERRLRELGIQANHVTKQIKERICKDVLIKNSKFNRVADYMDTLIIEHGEGDASVLDEFMKALTFSFERKPREDPEDFVKRCEREEKLYRELFHKFFIRMHGRIRGTRKHPETGDYLGPIANDIVPVLEGPQGIGKTTLCQWLACDDLLYIDLGNGLKQSFGSEETVKKCRGKLIVEIGEMGVMKSNDDVQKIKSFTSARFGDLNIKYVEGECHAPLTFSCIGTDNSGQYLVDITGNRRFNPVRLKNIDLDFLRDNQTLAKRLHAYYQSMVCKMTTDEILEACKASDELNAMMDGLREDALITYSDYEACMKLLRKWKENNSGGGTVDQADIERMAIDDRYMVRISRRSFLQAVQNSGFVQARTWEPGGKAMKVWKWEPAGALPDEVPF